MTKDKGLHCRPWKTILFQLPLTDLSYHKRNNFGKGESSNCEPERRAERSWSNNTRISLHPFLTLLGVEDGLFTPPSLFIPLFFQRNCNKASLTCLGARCSWHIAYLSDTHTFQYLNFLHSPLPLNVQPDFLANFYFLHIILFTVTCSESIRVYELCR